MKRKEDEKMKSKQKCIYNLDAAIESLEKIKCLIKQNRFEQAIAKEANLLYYLGRTLNSINHLQFINETPRIKPPTFPEKTMDHVSKQQCIYLVNLGLNNLNKAKSLLIQDRFEEAENVIISTITGRILHCLAELL